jgi:hypothetical protein
MKILLKRLVIFLQSWTSTGYFSNPTGSFVTNCLFSPIIVRGELVFSVMTAGWFCEKSGGIGEVEDVKPVLLRE